MALQARQARIEISTNLREGVRRKLLLGIDARASGGAGASATVHDISETGLLIESDLHLNLRDVVEVELPQADMRSAEVVWLSGTLAGCRFVEKLTTGAVSAALLRGSFASLAPEKDSADHPSSKPVVDNERESKSELSMGAKAWAILGLSLLLWATIGGLAAWMLS